MATIEEMPGKLASAIAQSRQPVDTDAMWATDDGKATMYTLFIDSISPAPREDMTCDNARVDDIWQSWMNGTPIRVFAWERNDFNFRPCLNPTPVAGAAATDPHFVVTERFGSTSESPTITFAHPDPATTTTIRVRGDNWFVVRRPDGGETQALRLNTTDWEGRNNMVWLERTAAGYDFRGARAAADGTFEVDPDDCGQVLDQQRAAVRRAGRPAPLGEDRARPSRPSASRRTRRTTSSPGRRSRSTPTTSRPAVRSAR